MFATIVRSGVVIDGTANPATVADVGIRNGRIEAVGDLYGAHAAREIDASGRVVAPGFIDVHTHTDLAAYLPPEAGGVKLAGVRQGVTTEVAGNCGWTPFPAAAGRRNEIKEHISAVFGPATRTFDTFEAYRVEIAEQPLPVNLAPLVGHGTLRAAVVGLGRAQPEAGTVRALRAALAEALDHGAFGMSSGLVYPPGVYSHPTELHDLGVVLARRGRIYATHMRNDMDLVHEAVTEAIDVGRETGVAVQLSHLKVAGRQQWGTAEAILDQIGHAVAGGVDARGDVYPYAASSTLLRALLPPWVNEGGVEAMLHRLTVPAARHRIEAEFRTGLPGWQNFAAAAGWNGITIASAPARPELEGRSISEIADDVGLPPGEVVADLLLQLRADCVVVLHKMNEDDVRTFVSDPNVLIGSDTIPLPGRPHPRTAGTFARVLGRYVRDEGSADLHQMVRRMTSAAAERFNIPERGRLAPGYVADLVVFDPETVTDKATFASPLLPPKGIDHVLVAGEQVIRAGADTGARPGQVLEPA
ncbi:MAG TPA: D-aminoacylase [Beutenbergiaceae bacterium]|nr:D-aminoacylase [Beutenbergiaceae bacterium]